MGIVTINNDESISIIDIGSSLSIPVVLFGSRASQHEYKLCFSSQVKSQILII